MPVDLNTFVVFDFETTSADAAEAEIIEIAAVRSNGEAFECLVQTVLPVPEKSWEITKIDPALHAREAIPLNVAWPQFMDFLGDAPLAGHNILAYDLPILRRVAEQLGSSVPPGADRAVDSLRWAHLRYPVPESTTHEEQSWTLPGYKLGDLYHFFQGKPLEGAHRAVEDCRANWVVLQHLLSNPPLLSGQRMWRTLGLVEGEFYDTEPLSDDEWKMWFKKHADLHGIDTTGDAFPSTALLFPEWLEEEISAGRVKPAEIDVLLKALEGRITTVGETQRLLDTYPQASASAKFLSRVQK